LRFVGPTKEPATTTALLVFMLAGGTAMGSQRLWEGCRTRRGRLAVWLCVLGLLAGDVYSGASVQSSATGQAGVGSVSGSRSVVVRQREGECAQVSLIESVSGWSPLGAHLPPFSGPPGRSGIVSRGTTPTQESRKTPLFS
jgi:hypothetical protein